MTDKTYLICELEKKIKEDSEPLEKVENVIRKVKLLRNFIVNSKDVWELDMYVKWYNSLMSNTIYEIIENYNEKLEKCVEVYTKEQGISYLFKTTNDEALLEMYKREILNVIDDRIEKDVKYLLEQRMEIEHMNELIKLIRKSGDIAVTSTNQQDIEIETYKTIAQEYYNICTKKDERYTVW